MPLQATSGAASYDAFGGGAAAVPQYIEDVFSTYLYTGNESTQTINNGIDLSGKGGLVWIKSRSSFSATEVQQPYHFLSDTTKTSRSFLSSNTTNALASNLTISSFNSNGFSLDDQPDGASYGGRGNLSGVTYASWTFRKQPKFFDVVTFTADLSNANQRISHNLGSVPGTIIIKCTNIGGSFSDWWTYHRSLGRSAYLKLNATTASTSSTNFWGTSDPTSTDFGFNAFDWGLSSGTYVAYLFAHDAGGFGLTGTDNVISCGSYTLDGSGYSPNVELGYEPQWILTKPSSGTGNWLIVDTMRGWVNPSGTATDDANLRPNLSNAEATNDIGWPYATGFNAGYRGTAGQTWIYIAIRRGPMKVPTVGTSVFSPIQWSGAHTQTLTPGFATDLVIQNANINTTPSGFYWGSRLQGNTKYLTSASTGAEGTFASWQFDLATGTFTQSLTTGTLSTSIDYFMRRAPSFFDEVCYTGTGSATTQTHNLGVVPEMVIVKNNNFSAVWMVYHAALGNTGAIYLNDSDIAYYSSSYWNSTTPTSSAFSLGTSGNTNGGSGQTYVAYLFATCAGVSKVGSYTGTGTTKQIDCGFTAGARFVLIKRTDSTGDWYVWDTARGIVSGNDPYLLLNSSAAEVTSTDYIDTYSAGFEISSTAPSAINASGGSFIFLAIS